MFGPDIDPPELASTSPSGEIAGSTPPFQGQGSFLTSISCRLSGLELAGSAGDG
jgi:hypothetical protein